MSVEGMMKKDKVIKNAVEKFVSDCKEICGSYVA